MDQPTAKAEIAHARHDLREAGKEDIWRQAIEVGRATQIAGETQKQEKTETAGKTLTP